MEHSDCSVSRFVETGEVKSLLPFPPYSSGAQFLEEILAQPLLGPREPGIIALGDTTSDL